MPFTANYQGDRVNSLNISNQAWSEIKASESEYRTLTCPECCKPMMARAGNGRVSAHFAHKHDPITGSCNFTNETREHLFLKNRVFQICLSLGLHVELEKRINTQDSFRIADICLPEKKKLIEIQLAKKPTEEHFQRHEDYRQAGWDTLWLVWKKPIKGLRVALICPQSNGRILPNKKHITTADKLLLKRANTRLFMNMPVNVMGTPCEFSDVIGSYVFDDDSFTFQCLICSLPHWNDEQSIETILTEGITPC